MNKTRCPACVHGKRLLEISREFHRSLSEEQRVRNNPVRIRYLAEYTSELDAIEDHLQRLETEDER